MSFLKRAFLYFTTWFTYRRLYHRFVSFFIHLDVTPEPIIFMTLLVKNEEDILEENLLFHKAMGIDGFIVTDNNSTDKTPDILKKYERLGWIKEIIIEKGNNYDQEVWVDRMIVSARDRFKADWVINADADEFWYTSLGDLKKEFSNNTANVVVCPLKCVVPCEQTKNWQWEYVVKKPLDIPEKYGLSKYSIFCRQISKVVHRTQGYKRIYPGNHWVDMEIEKVTKKNNIIVYHYTIRGYQYYLNKVINGGKALENNPNQSFGQHWRYLYRLYLDGKLSEEYERIIGANCFERLLKEGIVEQDRTVCDFMQELYKQEE